MGDQRPKLFGVVFDLNQSPLPSPRETVADDGDDDDAVVVVEPPRLSLPRRNQALPVAVTAGAGVGAGHGQRVEGQSCREADGESMLCIDCRSESSSKGPRSGEGIKQWRCFKCLLKARGGDRAENSNGASGGGGRGGGGGIALLDINASPPEDMEVDDAAPADVARGNHGVKVQAGGYSSVSGCSVGLLSTFSSVMWPGKGSHVPVPSEISSRMDDLRSTHEGSDATHSAPGNIHGGATELYLEGLKEYIAERNGVLGDGWHVEFDFCNKRLKTIATFCAPDGSRFESLSDVARHLGLPTNPHPPQSANAENGTPLYQRRQESPLSARAGDSQQRPSMNRSPLKSSSSGVESLNSSQDGFPIQFEDFYLISVGVIDPRPSYRNPDQIWPVGYRSVWHDKITGSLFVFGILDGGDSGPNFVVQRYPCVTQTMPSGSIVLSKPICKDNAQKDDSTRFDTIDEESISIQMMLTESSPPHLDGNIGEFEFDSQREILPSSDSFSQRSGNFTISEQRYSIGEFSVEGKSPPSVWEKLCETFIHACFESYNKKGLLHLGCDHCEMYETQLETFDSLSKFSHLAGPRDTPRLISSSNELQFTCDLVTKWLRHDRFGLDAEFVQEIIEQLPGVSGCSGYTLLTDRKHHSMLETVGSGFLLAKRKCDRNLELGPDGYFGILRRATDHSKHSELRGPLPPGKPICSRLPADLISDALQVWEFLCRFSEVLGLQPFPFQELADDLINPRADSLNSWEALRTEIRDSGYASSGSSREAFRAGDSCHSSCICTGITLTDSHGSLLKVLVSELLSKVAAYVDPNFDAGESKLRRGRKKDAEHSAVLKKMKLEMMPINDLTWPEIARRYIVALLSVEGNLDSAEIACRESGKVFYCLRGDGGTLCGSLTGMAALEADALLLAEATRKIFGSLMTQNEAVSSVENETDTTVAPKTNDTNNSELPEWAQVLEPVRKLPTNVGARIRKCVNEALSRNPPEWARQKLEHSISREVYKGNASGPTKRAVVEVLANVTREKLQQKPEKKEKMRNVYTVSDLIMKQCRVVLRQAVSADKDRVFCNLLARTCLNPNDNDDEGILGHPAMVSRPLDFRTIDIRLAAGAYGGSHEAFLDDVREVWRNVHIAYGEDSNLIELAETLSQQFEVLYEKEVLSFIQKTVGAASGTESQKERDEVLALVNDSSLPKAPWEEGICKVCGMDKDDVNVLLCDTCDSEYHTYCLNPPLGKVPDGNWYCPSCVTGNSLSEDAAYGTQVVNQCGKRRYQRKLIDETLEGLAQLANKMELKEYWEFTVEERILLLKFFSDEAMNSATIRDHIDQCASMCVDLHQRLRSLNSERKILKLKEESLAANVAKMKGNVHTGGGELASVLADESQLPVDNKVSSFSGGSVPMDGGPHTKDQVNILRSDVNLHPKLGDTSSSVSVQSSGQQMLGYGLSNTVSKNITVHASSFPGHQYSNQPNANSLLDYNAELSKLQQEISGLQESISTAESELLKVSLRKEFLGRDSYGRLYWVFGSYDASPWIVANGSLNVESEFGLDNHFPKSSSWMYYDTVAEIGELVKWLDDCDIRERDLKESILQWQSNKSLNSNYQRNDFLKGKPSGSVISSEQRVPNHNCRVLKGVRALEKKFGLGMDMGADYINKNLEHNHEMTYQGRMRRCVCLELIWPSRHHCFSCHQTFSASEELDQHGEKCRAAATGAAGSLKHNKTVMNQGIRICPGSSNIPQSVLNEKHDTQSNCVKPPEDPEFPFSFEEIMANFKVDYSIEEDIKGIGLFGTNGVVPFLPNSSPCFNDPALTLVPSSGNEVSMGDQTSVPKSQQKLSDDLAKTASVVKDKSSGIEKGKGKVSEVECMKSRVLCERGRLSSSKDKSSVSTARRSIIRESSLRPKVGYATEVLRLLKISMLDIDAALPEAALRASRSHLDRRCAWRTFVKCANTLYEMMLALIILEDTIRTDYLKNNWWYWSSPSAASNMPTLSALALRIFTLDSAILYEKSSTDDTAGTSIPVSQPDKEASSSAIPTTEMKSAEQPMQKVNDSDSGENSRPRTRMSRRKKTSSG